MPNENSLNVDVGLSADGGTPAASALAIGGNNGSAFQVLKVNSDGELVVNLESVNVGDINVGDVDIASATYEYAADSAHAAANKGVLQLAVRNDTLASLVSADGDYAPLQIAADGSASSAFPYRPAASPPRPAQAHDNLRKSTSQNLRGREPLFLRGACRAGI